jgi:hypothetical protein
MAMISLNIETSNFVMPMSEVRVVEQGAGIGYELGNRGP